MLMSWWVDAAALILQFGEIIVRRVVLAIGRLMLSFSSSASLKYRVTCTNVALNCSARRALRLADVGLRRSIVVGCLDYATLFTLPWLVTLERGVTSTFP